MSVPPLELSDLSKRMTEVAVVEHQDVRQLGNGPCQVVKQRLGYCASSFSAEMSCPPWSTRTATRRSLGSAEDSEEADQTCAVHASPIG